MIPPLFALFSWPVVAAVLFKTQSRTLAIILTIMGGYLFLPERIYFNLPILPTLDKRVIPVLSALAFAFWISGSGNVLKGFLPRSKIAAALIIVFVISTLMTGLANSDAVQIGQRILPGLRPYDAFSAALVSAIIVLPLLVGRKFLATQAAHRTLLLAIAGFGLVYALLALLEVRLSPQLNNWIYGFFPHGWVQHVRGGGFRPIVFLSHGLEVSLFLSMATLAALALSRAMPEYRFPFLGLAGFLFLALFLSKSLGAYLICLLLAPIILFLPRWPQILAAFGIGLMIICYPIARGADLVPVDRALEFAESIDESRANSLRTRVVNEDILLARAQEKPLLGWGGWGRSRVFDDEGRDISITDGYWVISFGLGGWTRYISEFGLLMLPNLLLLFRFRRFGLSLETVALTILLSANLIDLIPNSNVSPLTWLVAGALWGRVEQTQISASVAPEPAETGPTPPTHIRGAPTVASEQASGTGAGRRVETGYTRQTKRIYRNQ